MPKFKIHLSGIARQALGEDFEEYFQAQVGFQIDVEVGFHFVGFGLFPVVSGPKSSPWFAVGSGHLEYL